MISLIPGDHGVILQHPAIPLNGVILDPDDVFKLWEQLGGILPNLTAPAIEFVYAQRDPDDPETTARALRCPHCGTTSFEDDGYPGFYEVDHDTRENEALYVVDDRDGHPVLDVAQGDSEYATLVYRCTNLDCQRVVNLPLDANGAPALDVVWS